jgi:hypothetical protein
MINLERIIRIFLYLHKSFFFLCLIIKRQGLGTDIHWMFQKPEVQNRVSAEIWRCVCMSIARVFCFALLCFFPFFHWSTFGWLKITFHWCQSYFFYFYNVCSRQFIILWTCVREYFQQMYEWLKFEKIEFSFIINKSLANIQIRYR